MSGKIERTIKLVTQSQILIDLPPAGEGFPMRKWSIKIVAVGPDGSDVPATFVDKVTYKLHPSFEKPTRNFKKPPFKLEEQGWGEFDMLVTLHFAEKGGSKDLAHDLHFQSAKYETTHVVDFTKPSTGLLKLLAESGETPGFTASAPAPVVAPAPEESKKRKLDTTDDHRQTKKAGTGKGKDWTGKPADMDRLAAGLQKLQEDDLLQLVRIVQENKTPDMYVKNDLEEGEFSLDLYTLGDPLLRTLWDFTKQRVEV